MPRNAKPKSPKRKAQSTKPRRRDGPRPANKRRRTPPRKANNRSGMSLTTTARVTQLSPLFKRAKIFNGAIHLPGRMVRMDLGTGRRNLKFPAPDIRANVQALRASLNPTKDRDQIAKLQYFENAMDTLQSGTTPVTLSSAADAAVGTGLSDCAALYGKASCNPFGTFEMNPCIPSSPPTMSQRMCSRMRGTFSTGSGNAYGFLAIYPGVLDLTNPKLVYTTSSWAGTGTTGFTATTGAVNAYLTDVPYTSYELQNGICSRTVAMAVRWRCITAAGTVGGICAALQSPTNNTIGNWTLDTVIAQPSALIVPNALKPLEIGEEQNTWNTFIWRPSSPQDLAWAGTDQLGYAFPQTMAIVCKAAGAQLFEYEVITFAEYSGISSNGGTMTAASDLMVSDADEVGLDRVLEGLQRAPLDLDAGAWAEQCAVGITESIAHSDSAARTVEALTGGDSLGLGQIVKIASSLLGFFLA